MSSAAGRNVTTRKNESSVPRASSKPKSDTMLFVDVSHRTSPAKVRMLADTRML